MWRSFFTEKKWLLWSWGGFTFIIFKNNISYTIIEPNKKEFVIKSYANNFTND